MPGEIILLSHRCGAAARTVFVSLYGAIYVRLAAACFSASLCFNWMGKKGAGGQRDAQKVFGAEYVWRLLVFFSFLFLKNSFTLRTQPLNSHQLVFFSFFSVKNSE